MRLSCHCGAVVLEVTPSAPLSAARRCDCSFCRRRAAATVSVPEGDLRIVQGADKLTLYQWHTKTAEHYFCSICGIYTHHRRRSDPTEFGVNLGGLEGVQPRDYEPLGWSDGVTYE
ncbi:GFA family protein [Aestuariibius sp. 2305UL40-4]|uniref:GFA family protein n=1 Tax=Aestuariibius violaceus TaxID=3234132 RepID=UPI00345EEC66